MVNAVLKFEDSSGMVEKTIPADSFGTNLGRLVVSARATPVLANLDSVLAFWGGLYSSRGLAACGCDSPLDSLILTLSDGRREAYVMHCSNIYRDTPRRSEKLGMGEVQRTQLSGRWDLLRERFCPKGYGCSDGKPEDRWSNYVERKTDEGWEWNPFVGQRFGYVLTQVLTEGKAGFPELTLILSLRMKDGLVSKAVVDSVDPAHRRFAKELVRRVRKLEKQELVRDGILTLRLQAWNFRREK